MGLLEEQHWTTAHSVTPFPSSDLQPQPCRTSSLFQVQHSSNSQPLKSAHTTIHKLSRDVLICPLAAKKPEAVVELMYCVERKNKPIMHQFYM